MVCTYLIYTARSDSHNLELSINGVNVIIGSIAYKSSKDMFIEVMGPWKKDPAPSERIANVVILLIPDCCGAQHQSITRSQVNRGFWIGRKKIEEKVGGSKVWVPMKLFELNWKWFRRVTLKEQWERWWLWWEQEFHSLDKTLSKLGPRNQIAPSLRNALEAMCWF